MSGLAVSAAVVAAAGTPGVVIAVVAWRRSVHAHRRVERALAGAQERLEALQRSFSRFVPPSVVEDVIDGGTLGPEKRDVTVLFADLMGFTPLSERLDPAVLVEMLNGYLAAMSAAIHAHRGHVAKFIGDGLMALWGAPEPNPWACADAVQAAVAMQRAMITYNATLRERGLPELRMGVGVHRGIVVAGVIGSDQLVEYTVIGDTVNVAARIESLTRQYDANILITEPVRRALDARFMVRAMAPAGVKGKSELVATWAVDGCSTRPAVAASVASAT